MDVDLVPDRECISAPAARLIVVGELGHQIMGECDVLCRGSLSPAVALTVVEPDALAEPMPEHAGTDLFEHPRTVAVCHDARNSIAGLESDF